MRSVDPGESNRAAFRMLGVAETIHIPARLAARLADILLVTAHVLTVHHATPHVRLVSRHSLGG